jgi:predicted dienelactone hydrolase
MRKGIIANVVTLCVGIAGLLSIGLAVSYGQGTSPGQIGPNTAQTASVSAPALPAPTGPYHIGTSVFHLTNTAMPDPLAKTPGQFRELMVQIWYPADAQATGTPAPYLPDPKLVQALKGEEHDRQDPAVFDSWLSVKTAAILDAPIAAKPASFPVLFFSHGLGESRSSYTAIVQDLASHGYVVICIDHPHGGITVLPDARVLATGDDPMAGREEGILRLEREWAADAGYVLGRMTTSIRTDPIFLRFAGRLDLSKVGMLGHSLGGAAALEACRSDERFRACADLDGAPFGKVKEEGVKRPTLILRSGPIYSDADLAQRVRTREQWEAMGRLARAVWQNIIDKSQGVPVYIIKVNGAGHMTFSDAPFVMPDTITRFGGTIIAGPRAYAITTAYLEDFFGKYLSGGRGDLIGAAKSPYSEVEAESAGTKPAATKH